MNPTYCAFNKTAESFLGLNICRADSKWSRLKSSLGTYILTGGDGLWVARSRGILTVNVLVPIDLVYLDRECRVVGLAEHLTGCRIGPLRSGSYSLLKLPAHAIHESHTRVGDQLLISAAEEMETYLKNVHAGVSRRDDEPSGN